MKQKLFKVRDDGGSERFFVDEKSARKFRDSLSATGIGACAYSFEIDLSPVGVVKLLNSTAAIPEVLIGKQG